MGKYLEEYPKILENFPFDLGSMEEYGLGVEVVVGICLGFLLDNIFSRYATSVVFFGSRLALMFFLPDAKIENVQSPGEIVYPFGLLFTKKK